MANSLNDNVVINTYERVVSDDINVLQQLAGRMRSELARAVTRRFQAGGIPGELGVFGIASGLKISTSGTSVIISAGALFQWGVPNNPPDVPAPDTLDSSLRYGILTLPDTVSIPSRGVDTYWLVQGRVIRSDTLTTTRDVYNPTTQTFSPQSILKRQESIVDLELKEGTSTTIPTADTGYTPIGALLMRTGAGSVQVNETYQMAPQMHELSNIDSSDSVCKRTSFKHRSNQQINEASTGSEFEWACEINGYKLFAKTDISSCYTNLRTAPFIDTNYSGVLGTASLWWYVYLCAPDTFIPENLYTDGTSMDVEHRGLIIASRVRPDVYGTNSAALGVPLPIGGTIPIGQGACMGIFKANGTGSDIDFVDVSIGGLGRVERQQFRQGSGSGFVMTDANSYLAGTYNLATLGASSTEDVPYGVQLHCWIANQDSTGFETTPPPYALRGSFTMTNDTSGNHERLFLPLDNFSNRRFDLHPEENSLSITVFMDKIDSAGLIDTNPSASNFIAGIIGYSF